MTDEDLEAREELPAGNFSSWLSGMQRALRGERASNVPCGACTACCTSSQFVHIEPDEADTLAHVPGELLFPAPGLPDGHVLLGYDEHGHCPMLTDNLCSIYEHRPRTCRTYDCRILPAAGLDLEGHGKPAVARQIQRWRFTFADEVDRDRHAAVRAAATMLREQHDGFPGGAVPSNPTQLAVLAVEVHDAFLLLDGDTGHTTVVAPPPEVVEAEVLRRTRPRDVS